jgi:hypothetical protein
MPDSIITLTTDFGEASPYVAAMKGVILGLNPAARIVDLSHRIAPQNLRHAAFFLASAVPYFPPEVIHVVVVDPGVGSDRALLYVEVGSHRLLVPDNGCWTQLADGHGTVRQVIRLAETRYWRPEVSATFHGRDVLAPVAAHLSRGVDPRELGPPVDHWACLAVPRPRRVTNGWEGEVLFVDDFGNLITNIPAAGLLSPDELVVGDVPWTGRCRWVRTYADAPRGTLVALASSTGQLEVAVVQGSAAQSLQAAMSTPVRVGWGAENREGG